MILKGLAFYMKNLKVGRPQYFWKTIGIPVVLFAVVLAVFVVGVAYFSDMNTKQNLALTENAIRKATVQCYADEGFYPPTLGYLEDNYGVVIDYGSFDVTYDCAAANIMPNIIVFQK